MRVVTGQHLLNVPEFRAKPAYTLRYLGTFTSYLLHVLIVKIRDSFLAEPHLETILRRHSEW